jgi:hypothetical protein
MAGLIAAAMGENTLAPHAIPVRDAMPYRENALCDQTANPANLSWNKASSTLLSHSRQFDVIHNNPYISVLCVILLRRKNFAATNKFS